MSDNLQLNRRQFIKICSSFLASSALATPIVIQSTELWGDSSDSDLGNDHSSKESIIPSLCELCFWRCGINAHLREGKVVKITGQADHPLSNGKLCPRGTAGHGLLYDPDRLTHPLIREHNSAGKAYFRQASWDEATQLIADRLQKITTEHGPQAISLFYHGFGASFFKNLLAANGSTTFTATSYAQCRGPRDEAFKLTFGHEIGSPEGVDVRHSKYLVFLGYHLGENMHNTAVQDFAYAIKKGVKLVVVDPRFSTAAGKAHKWLPIKAGTDLALLRAWIHILIKEKLYDIDFIKENAIGLEELTAGVKTATPENTYAITGIATDDIVAIARDLGRYKNNALVHPGRHVTWYGDDTQRLRAIAIINALLGNYRMPGGIIQQDKIHLDKAKVPKQKQAKHFQSRYPFASHIPANEVIQQTLEQKPYPIKSWFVYGTNIIQSIGNRAETIKAIQKLDFMVAVDVLPMEITAYADVVLPECTYLERYDDLDNRRYRTPYIALRQPVVKPMYNSLPGHEIARMLALKMGFETRYPELFPKLFPKDMPAYLDQRLKPMGSSLAELKKSGVITAKPQFPLYRSKTEQLQFDTPSGKIELACASLQQAGFDAVPQFHPHPKTPKNYFRLLFGRSPSHSFGRTTNNRILLELVAENELWVNSIAGRDFGLQQGEYVYLVNQDGAKSKTKIKVKLTQRIRPDVVYMVHGFGHSDARLKGAVNKGCDDNDLISKITIDPIMGGTGMQNNFVTFRNEN